MSVIRRLYNVAYGKVRSWGSGDDLGDPGELEGSADRARPWKGVGGLTGGTVAEESVARLREQLSRLEAEARLDSEPVRRTGGIRRDLEPEVEAGESEAPAPAKAGPKQRRL